MFSSIRSKLIVSSIVLVLAATIPISVALGFLIKKSVYQNSSQSIRQQMAVVDQLLAVFYDDLDSNLNAMADQAGIVQADSSITNFLSDKGGTPSPEGKGEVEKKVYRELTNYGEKHAGTLYTYIGTEDGGYAQWPYKGNMVSYDPRKRPWYRMAMENPGKISRTDPYVDSVGGNLLVSNVRTFPATGRPYGVIGIDVSSEGIANIIKEIHIGKTGYAMILHKSGLVMADPRYPEHSLKPVKELELPNIEKIMDGDQVEFVTEIKGIEYMVSVYASGKTDWVVAAFVETEELAALGRTIQKTVAVIALLVVVVISLLVAFFSGRAMRPIHQMVDGLKDVAQGEGDLTLRLKDTGKDEISEMGRWFNVFMEKLQGIVGDISGKSDQLMDDAQIFTGISREVADGASRVSSRSDSVASATEEMSTNMTSVAAAAEQCTANINMVSAAAEEMTSTIGEIAKNAEETRQTSNETVVKTESAAQNITQLKQAANEIGHVVDTINDIADQTNLLALNATIEAARAGEAGKGFAVVANEIKDLALQTTSATQEIKERIQSVQDSTQGAVTEIEGISGGIQSLNQMIDAVAAAVEEQSATTREIAGNVSQAAQGIQEVTENVSQTSAGATDIARDITDVNQGVGEMAENAGDIDSKAGELNELASGLKETMSQFKV